MNCSINTEAHCDSLVAAIRDVLDACDRDFEFIPHYRETVFRVQYPRISDALDRAQQLIEEIR